MCFPPWERVIRSNDLSAEWRGILTAKYDLCQTPLDGTAWCIRYSLLLFNTDLLTVVAAHLKGQFIDRHNETLQIKQVNLLADMHEDTP